jgi:hypothetical protein
MALATHYYIPDDDWRASTEPGVGEEDERRLFHVKQPSPPKRVVSRETWSGTGVNPTDLTLGVQKPMRSKTM